MAKHKRDTFKLGYVKYRAWCEDEFFNWLEKHFSDMDFPHHIVPDLAAVENAIDNYAKAIGNHHLYKSIAAGANSTATASFKRCYLALKQVKIALGTLPDPLEIRAEFNLSMPLPMKRSKIHVIAQNALKYWEQVKTEPLYLPFTDYFANLIDCYEAFDSSWSRYYDEARSRAYWQNEKVYARAAIYAIDRAVFRWYRSRHPDPHDEWWTATPWGKRTKRTAEHKDESDTSRPD